MKDKSDESFFALFVAPFSVQGNGVSHLDFRVATAGAAGFTSR